MQVSNQIYWHCRFKPQSALYIRYFVGVRNKRTNVVTIRPAPIQVFSRNVKALKGLASVASSSTERIVARNQLGETFGTKKSQKAIRAAERNKVDVSAMQGVTSHIQGSIEAKTQSLPTQGWTDHEIEMLLSEAFVLNSTWANAQSHFS